MERSSKPLIATEKFEIFADGLDHPEGLVFDTDGNLWAGGELGQVYRIDRRGRVRQVTVLGGFCLGLAFSPQQVLYVCNLKKHSLIWLTRSGRVRGYLDRVGSRKLATPNFSVFDRAGNCYFTDSGEWPQSNGWIYRLRPNGRAEAFLGPLAFPNGLALSADEKHLFVAQSLQNNVLRIEIKPDGRASARHVYARNLARVPDGLALDGKGNLYVTCYASDNVYRVTPRGKVSLLAYDPMGTVLARPTNAAFGGAGNEYLYLANLGRWHICRVRLGVKGQPLAHQSCHG